MRTPGRMLVNLWMLKARNGMYWYAMDYVLRIGVPTTFLLRKRTSALFKADLEANGFEVKEAGFLQFVSTTLRCLLDGRFIFTPTPHPIPFLRNQVCVVHDAFPFEGSLAALKRSLFQFGIRTSRSTVAHINRSICLPFLAGLGLPHGTRFVFAPNVAPTIHSGRAGGPTRTAGTAAVLGAFGTDSSKKSYESLLSHPRWDGRFKLRIYGHGSTYAKRLQQRFGAESFELVSSDEVSVGQFLQSVSGVLSVAHGEGFGRPLATAIAAGIPCHLLDSPAFREFFDGNACFYPDVASLLQGIEHAECIPNPRPVGFLSPDHSIAIDLAAAQMRRMAQK